MKIIPSVCTNLWFPASRKDIGAFRDTADFLKDKGVRMIEFYHDGPDRDQCGKILNDRGFEGMYVGVIPHKEKLQHLCNPDEAARVKAVELGMACIDEAAGQGIKNVMYNSGRTDGGTVEAGMEAFHKSFTEMFNHVAKKGYDIEIGMEPCDSWMDSCQMIGSTELALVASERLRKEGMPFWLVMDSAHNAEQGENFIDSVTKVKPYCKHIHYANCLINDPKNPLYGDKHLGFEFADSVWTFGTLKTLTTQLDALYEGQEVRVALEVLCREEDPYAYFTSAWNQLPFWHQQ